MKGYLEIMNNDINDISSIDTGKKTEAAYRMLRFLEAINKDLCSSSDVLRNFEEDKSIKGLFSDGTINKYISTLKLMGFEVERKNVNGINKYFIKSSPLNIDLSENDIIALSMGFIFIKSLHQKKLERKYTQILEKINIYLPEEDKEKLKKCIELSENIFKFNTYEKYRKKINLIEEHIDSGQTLSITHYVPSEKDKITNIIEPDKFKYYENRVFLLGYDPISQEKKLIDLEHIDRVSPTCKRIRGCSKITEVQYILKGRLAKGYTLKENDRIKSRKETGDLVIISRLDNIDMFIKKIMRYGDCCEVISPKFIRQKIVDTIEKTLNFYK